MNYPKWKGGCLQFSTMSVTSTECTMRPLLKVVIWGVGRAERHIFINMNLIKNICTT